MSLMIKELLNMAERRLKNEGIENAKLDAELLFYFSLKVDRIFLITHYGEDLDDRRCEAFLQLVDKRAGGYPLQYIVGTQEFMGLPFKVNESVLIPRQDTETMVELALDELAGRKCPMGGFEILDLCCGSGAIGVSLAYHLGKNNSKCKITCSDVSKDALDVASENAKENSMNKAVRFVHSDLFSGFPKNKKGQGKKQFDLIISNPPYIPSDVIPTLQREVQIEPRIALDGGVDGLQFYRRIADEASAYLKKGGLFMVEIGHDQSAALLQLLEEKEVYRDILVQQDLTGKDRIVRAVKSLD